MSSRAVRAAVVLAVTAASTAVGAAPAQAAGRAGHCPDADGVTVVVDFKELGGGVVVRCAPGDQATGLAALKSAGFQITGTLRWGEGFICRIEGKPSAATEKCVDTPPASAYWSYWHAPDGGAWTYSDKGVLNRKPPAGSFEGWSFSLNRSADNAPRPAVAPNRPAPPRTTPPAPPPPRTSAPAPPPPAPTPPAPGNPPPALPPPTADAPVAPGVGTPTGAGGTPAASVPVAPTGDPSGPAPQVPPTASVVPPLGAAPVPSTDPTGSLPPVEVTGARDGDGLPLGTLAGLFLLVALVGGGVLAARRRRTPDD
ncbi:hypothetical protein JMF97_23370 [Micromonospora fiedleri]|uniref:Gram-positive cocci surface proteins LPxTG domain-containing protein n=2 Tax=Micromonospora TaxID=1873 RepID=A0ABS1USC7_9ACTN|nr:MULTISPECIES: hypothetical protein [Micromonospora]MBL6279104.1 hypothetical protein [Micromonospora fiedleri]PMR62125.1 hypothetical protein C1A38_05145 [Verrucosispora sp. ts21]WSK43764.1 hypothetical protein OG712_06360 [Micromonospora maris]GIJ19220.1 hypothetical protein Vgi01_59040 [Micromonospora gifhornensis]